MSFISDVFSGKVDAVPFIDRPSWLGGKNDNEQSIRGGRQEANVGVWWKGANGHYYTNDNARGVVDRGTNYSPPGGYTRINDPNPPSDNSGGGGGGSTSTGGGGGGSFAAPAKVLDTAQLASLDSFINSLGTIKDQMLQKAGIKRDTSFREKEEEKRREEGKYQGKKLATLQEFAGAKTDTDLNTRNTLENLISSLSTLGLGGSRALTRQILDAANQANRKANLTQATNNRDLDTSWNEYQVGNENDIKKIQDQYGFDAGEAERDYLQKRQNALYKKADVFGAADRTAERDAVMNEGNALNEMISRAAFMNPQYTGEAREMKTPELADYTQDIAQYDTTGVTGADAPALTPVTSDGMNAPGNLAIRAIAVNDKDLGIKKKTEDELGYGV